MKSDKKTNRIVLYTDNFSSGVIPGQSNSPYQFLFAPAGMEGVVTARTNLLKVSSSPYTTTSPDVFDHLKYLVYQSEPYIAPDNNLELCYESVMNGQQTFPETIPFPYSLTGVNNARNDPRLCCSALAAVDLVSLVVADIIFTNEGIFAIYERLPFNRPPWNPQGHEYQAFTHIIPLAKRTTGDYTKVMIAYNKTQGYIRWLINGQEKFRVNKLGYPIERQYRVLDHGGTPELVRPNQFSMGFGNFSLMDMYNPNNPGGLNNAGLVDLTSGIYPTVNPLVTTQKGDPIPATYIEAYTPTNTIFGQGCVLNMVYNTVYIQQENECVLCGISAHCCEIVVTEAYLNSLPGVLTNRSIVKCLYESSHAVPFGLEKRNYHLRKVTDMCLALCRQYCKLIK